MTAIHTVFVDSKCQRPSVPTNTLQRSTSGSGGTLRTPRLVSFSLTRPTPAARVGSARAERRREGGRDGESFTGTRRLLGVWAAKYLEHIRLLSNGHPKQPFKGGANLGVTNELDCHQSLADPPHAMGRCCRPSCRTPLHLLHAFSKVSVPYLLYKSLNSEF